MKPRSSTLFHFTKNESILFDILINGFWPRYCLEDMRWQGFENFDYVAFPMVCFCDIPLARISEHVGFYGSYGIGLTKEWAEKNSLNPVIYISSSSNLGCSISQTMTNTLRLEEADRKKTIGHIRYISAYSKPTAGTVIVDGQPTSKDFYLESEWRYVPKNTDIFPHLVQSSFEDASKLSKANKESKDKASLKILATDVSYIFVPKDSDIPNVIDFLMTKLGEVPNADLKVLYSRVISIEGIERDV